MPKAYSFTRALAEKCGLSAAEAARLSELARRALLLALSDEGTCDIEGIVRLSARARRQATFSPELTRLLDRRKDPRRQAAMRQVRAKAGRNTKKMETD